MLSCFFCFFFFFAKATLVVFVLLVCFDVSMQLLHSVVAVALCWFGVGGGILCVNFMAALSGDACKFRIRELKKNGNSVNCLKI